MKAKGKLIRYRWVKEVEHYGKVFDVKEQEECSASVGKGKKKCVKSINERRKYEEKIKRSFRAKKGVSNFKRTFKK